MSIAARYVHTNVIAHDWQRLANFYIEVFGCQPVLPERHLNAPWVAQATHVPEAALDGVHLRLPGYGEAGPTLEIFQYRCLNAGSLPEVDRTGLAHLAFAVDDVDAALAAVLKAGGGVVGDVVHVEVSGAGGLTFVYARDPEGNILELQKWER